MVSLTIRLLLATAVLAVSLVSAQSTQDEIPSDIPCVAQRTAKGCRKEKTSFFSHCVWCESKAVPPQCVTPEIAEKLPKLVFKCDGEEEDGEEEDGDEKDGLEEDGDFIADA